MLLLYWRTDYETPAILFGLKQAQVTAIVMLVTIVPIFVVIRLRTRQRTALLQPS
ncbi:MAG TPA: hypothetical protein VGA41_07735 [Candidatus Dormibacteraeota bacterium]